jgi:hypothetical protein
MTFDPTPQPSIFQSTPAPTDKDFCDIRRPLLDPVCIHASSNTDDFVCYPKENLLPYISSYPDCNNHTIEVSVDSCTDVFYPYPGSAVLQEETRTQRLKNLLEDYRDDVQWFLTIRQKSTYALSKIQIHCFGLLPQASYQRLDWVAKHHFSNATRLVRRQWMTWFASGRAQSLATIDGIV